MIDKNVAGKECIKECIIDACGLSCPEPLLKLKQYIQDASVITLKADNPTSVEMCSRFAKSQGFAVIVKEAAGIYLLELVK